MSSSSHNRDYREPHRDRGYAADYYEEHPVNRGYARRRDYRQQPRHSRQEPRRRASSVGDDRSYRQDNRSRRNKSRTENGSYYQRPEYDSTSESDRSSNQRNRRRSTAGPPGDGYRDQDRSRDRGEDNSNGHHGWANTLRDKGGQLIVQAALPLIAAGAAEALRSRKEPGEWKGDKGKHVVKAAVTNGLVNRDPSKPHAHHIVDATASGLKGGYPTRDELAAIQRRAGGNRTMSNAKKVAAAGAIAFAGIEIYDRYGRSRSQKRSEPIDKYSGRKRRSQSVSDKHSFDNRRDSSESDESDYRAPRSQYRDHRPDQWGRSYYGRDHDNRYRDYSPGEY